MGNQSPAFPGPHALGLAESVGASAAANFALQMVEGVAKVVLEIGASAAIWRQHEPD